MNRLQRFTSVFGENWVIGRYLLPVLKMLGRDERGVLLDLACGESPFRECFPDVSMYLRVDSQPIDPEVIQGDMRKVPVEDGSVDVVLLCQAISDVPDPVEVLREVRRVLRPAGRLVVFESMSYPEHDFPNDYMRLMPEGLRVFSGRAGLQLSECIRLGGLFTRFAVLWSSFVMGGLKRNAVLRVMGNAGVATGNLVCYVFDLALPHPRLASDYVAILTIDEGSHTDAGVESRILPC